MFAYCNCNPTNLCDPGGAIPFYDDPLQKAIEDFCQWYRDTDENEKGKGGEYTLGGKAKRTIQSAIRNLEFSFGIGQGIYVEGELLETVGFSVGMYGNYGSINYQDGEWFTGQELHYGISGSFMFLEIGAAENKFRRPGGVDEITTWKWVNDKEESITIFSSAFYPIFAGYSIRIGFDLNTFIKDVIEIWG